MARELFAHPDDLEWSDMYRYAVAVGLPTSNASTPDVRVHASKVLHRVQDDAQDAEVMDLNSTPTFFVNGKRHKGPWDAASLIRALEAGRRANSIASHALWGGTGSRRHRCRATSPACSAVW